MTVEPGRWLLVELAEGLERSRRVAAWDWQPDCVSVLDLAAVSQSTLNTILLLPPVVARPARIEQTGLGL